MINTIKEILNRRDLVWELALKNLKIRYSRPYLGFFWAFLLPFFTALVYYFVFSKIFKAKIEEIPFFLYLMSAIFPWSFFQGSVMCSVTSLIDSRNLIRESKFGHYLITAAIIVENLIVFLPPLLILVVTSAITLHGLPLSIIFLPLILFLHALITLGLSFIFAILYVKWRDLKYVLEMSLLFLFNFTPAFYSIDLIKNALPDFLFKLYIYNPFVCMLNLYRIVLIKGFSSSVTQNIAGVFPSIAITVSFVLVILWLAYKLYSKNKNTINDYLSY